MSEETDKLEFWSRGDELTANRLNQMVCKINNLVSKDVISGRGASVTNLGGSVTPNTGKYIRDLHYMHTDDGVGKIVDSYVKPKLEDSETGNYARKNGVGWLNASPWSGGDV